MGLKGKGLAVAIPDTVLEEKSSLREKTAKLGYIARACAIYGVDTIEVFRDRTGRGEARTVIEVLRFLETPQYLRRRLFPIDETLRFAGILPPLRIGSHKPMVSVDQLELGEVREGVSNGDGTVDIGLSAPALISQPTEAGARLTVAVSSKSPLTVSPVGREQVKRYWGYSVEARTASEVYSDPRYNLKISTSRQGEPLAEKIDSLRIAFGRSTGVKLVFGSPTKGLHEMLGRELVKGSDFVINLFVDQHVETVRTEEALMAGLNLMNVLSAEKA
jgi:methyltransferase